MLDRWTSEGVEYVLTADGRLYQVEADSEWVFVAVVFDPDEVERSYVLEGGVRYRVDPGSGDRFPTTQTLDEGFEDLPTGADGLRALIDPARGWTTATMQSPETPTVEAYVALLRRVLEGSDFGDARVEPLSGGAARGSLALSSTVPAPTPGMTTSKASLTTGLVYFVEGDDVWFEASYFVSGDAVPFSLADLEGDLLLSQAGIRVVVFEDGDLGVELKARDKPTFRAPSGQRTPFPTGQWVRVRWHLRLGVEDGHVRLWQDDALLVDAPGPTLPFPTAIYNSLELGVSAHSFGTRPVRLLTDAVRLSPEPFSDGPSARGTIFPRHVETPPS